MTDTDPTAPGLPLTAAQQGIVDAMTLWPGSPRHVLAEYVDLRGDLDVGVLTAAIGAMVADTVAQRITVVRNGDGAVRQMIADPADVPIDLIDLTGAPDPARRADEIMHTDAASGTDPFAGVTTRHLVLRLGDRHVRWYHRAHHVALDGYGFALCAQRVADHHRRLAGMASEVRARQGDSAPGHTAGTIAPGDAAAYREVVAADTAYRTGPGREADRIYWRDALHGSTVRSLSEGHVSGTGRGSGPLRVRRTVTTWPQRPDVPYPELIIAAVAIHVSRALRRPDVTVGVPVMNRLGTPAARVPAMIVNAIAVPVTVGAGDTVATLTTRIGRDLRQHRRHARYRHEWLRRDLGRVGGGDGLFGPLVNIMAFDYAWDVPDIEATAHNVRAGPVEDMAFQIYLRGGRVELCLDADPDRYRPEEAAAHLDAVIGWVTRAAADITRPVEILGRDHRVIATPSPAPVSDPMRMIEWHAHADPTAPAIRTAGGDVTRGQLREMIDRRATELAAQGVMEGCTVPIVPGHRVADIVTILAAQRLGAAHAANPPNDTGTPGAGMHRGAGPERPTRGGYLVTTSGSTGTPKTVRVGGRALAAFVTDAVDRYGWTQADVVAQLAPLHADTSIEEIFVTLAAGAVLAVPGDPGARTPAELLSLTEELGITVLDLPTALWHELARTVAERSAPATLRQIVIGGEEASPELVASWPATGVDVVNSYGPSEATVVAAAATVTPADVAGGGPVPLGTVFAHTGAVLRIEHDDTGHRWDSATHTGVGELLLYGPTLADGYPGDPGFGLLDLGDGPVRTFATGDLVRVRAGGVLEFLDRIDDVLKVGGARIHVRTIEDAMRRLPGVESVMVCRAGAYAVQAFVTGTLDAGAVPAMRARLAAVLPPAWVPVRITGVDTLPRTATGKVDRTAPPRPPRGPLLDGVRRVVTDVLGFAPRDDESIFAAGVTSLQAVAIAGRVADVTGTAVRVDDVLDAATIAGIAARAADGKTRIDVRTEVATLLPATVTRRAPSGHRVMLTGATGFIGGAVLPRLLRAAPGPIVLPIRASSERSARQRLCRSGDSEWPALIEAAVDDGRVVPVPCTDLMDGIDRAGPCSHVIHLAAEISSATPYSALRRVNVAATAALARAAAEHGARTVYASTVTAAGPAGALHADPGALPTGYAQSKSVAEHMVSAAGRWGADSAIMRLPRVVPGSPGQVRSADILVRLARVSAQLGALPDTDLAEPMAQVDDIAELLIAAAFTSGPEQAPICDVYSPRPIPVVEVLRHACPDAPTLPLADWRGRVARCPDIDAADRAAATVWCDILLSGFTADWSSPHAVRTPPIDAASVARLLGIDRIGTAWAPVVVEGVSPRE